MVSRISLVVKQPPVRSFSSMASSIIWSTELMLARPILDATRFSSTLSRHATTAMYSAVKKLARCVPSRFSRTKASKSSCPNFSRSPGSSTYVSSVHLSIKQFSRSPYARMLSNEITSRTFPEKGSSTTIPSAGSTTRTTLVSNSRAVATSFARNIRQRNCTLSPTAPGTTRRGVSPAPVAALNSSSRRCVYKNRDASAK
mmetsp:Transcript_7974/g.22606  ORF Transcript_7974/g.22606 Transcript_7974/m.22606 type:complete len:200 (-) Transcript_7974:147-746(-)